jgi:phage terminase small subunit
MTLMTDAPISTVRARITAITGTPVISVITESSALFTAQKSLCNLPAEGLSAEAVAAKRYDMNARQIKFVQKYLLTGNATQAAIAAGYREQTARQQGCRLLTNADIVREVSKAQQKMAERCEITQDQIIADIAAIGAEARAAGVFAPALKAKELIGKHIGMWPNRLGHTGKDGRPVEVEERKMLDITALSWEQRDQLKQILLTVMPKEGE